MSYKHTFDPIALLEYHDAVAWYGEKSLAAMDNFIAAVNVKIRMICAAPRLYRNVYKNSREVSLKKFPYSVVFFINEATKTIIITSVYHHKRNPKRKYAK